MSELACPHCGVENPLGSRFCQSCGKAVPSMDQSSPKVISDEELAETKSGQNIQSVELQKAVRKSVVTLWSLAILQFLAGVAFYFILKNTVDADVDPVEQERIIFLTVSVIVGLGIIFAILAIWARKSPLPASIVGLTLYVTVFAIDAMADPMALVKGWLIKIIILIALVNAIKAGVKHKRLQAVMNSNTNNTYE